MKYRFSDVEIDSERFSLYRNGKQIDIEPLILDLLLHFVTHPDKVLSRDELMAAVWSGRLVSDTTISSAVKIARKMLGDDGQKQKYIKTVHGRGFRFVGKLEDRQALPDAVSDIPSAAPSRPLATSTQKLSLIVLPFKVHTENSEIRHFVSGLSADLEVMLTRIVLLQISSEGSRYAGSDIKPTARQIYEETGALYVVEGSCLVSDNKLRLTVQLTDARAGFRIWSEHFEHLKSDEPERLILSVIGKLEPQLNRAIYDSVRSSGSTPTARELFLQANGLLSVKGWHGQTFLEAAELLRQSEALDPEFALSPANRALLLGFGHRIGTLTDREQAVPEAIAAAERALELDSMDSAVLGYTGCALADVGLAERAKPLLKNAIQINRANAQAWAALGALALIQSDIKTAIHHLSHSISISPLDSRLSIWGAFLAAAYLMDEDLANAQQAAEQACERDHKSYMPRITLAATKLAQTDVESARSVLEEAYRIKPDLSVSEINGIVGQKMGENLLKIR